MARDIRKLDVVKEMRHRNRMFYNPGTSVVLKSEEFFSKKPIFQDLTSGLPRQEKKKVDPEVREPKDDKPEGDRTLKDLLVDLNEGPEEEQPKREDEGVQLDGGEEGEGGAGAGDGAEGGGSPRGGGKRKRSASDVGGGEEEAQASKVAKAEAGRERQPDPEEEAQAEPPVRSGEDLPQPDAA